MFWIFLAISSHWFWAVGNIGDKYIVSKRVRNPFVYLVWITMLGVLSLVIIPWTGLVIPSAKTALFLLIGGLLYFYGGLPYIRAMQMEEPTRINVFWGFIPVFSLLIGQIFLKEVFLANQLLAFCFLLSGTVLASVHIKNNGRPVVSKAVWLMMLAGLAFAIYGVLFHLAVAEVGFIQGFIWISLIQFVCALTMFLSVGFKKDFVSSVKAADRGLIGAVGGIAFFEKSGILLNQWALSLGSAALVFAFEGFQVLFVFIIASLLSIFWPNIVREEMDKKNLLLKIASLLLLIGGILFLALA